MKAKIVKFTNEGIILNADGREYILKKGDFKNFKIGDIIDCEVEGKYAYLKENTPNLNEVKVYKIKSKSRVGFFLETNSKDDLFVPFSESYTNLKEGDNAVVMVLKDKENRLYGSMKLKKYLNSEHNYKENDMVKGIIYSIHPKLGAFVAVDNNIDGRLEGFEMTRAYEIGDSSEFRIKSVKPDGKLDLTLRKRNHLQIDKDTVKIMDRLIKNPVIELGDKSSPEKIFKEFKLSKQAFKRACGRLMRQGLIEITDHKIRRVEK